MSESEHSRETRSTRGTKLCAQETVGVRGEAFVLSPSHLSHLHRQPTPLSRMGSLAVCSALRPPRQQRLGHFCLFFPLPSGGLARVQRSTVSPRQRLGYFSRFLPLPLANARHLRHSLSDFKISPSDHQAGLPYSTPFFCTGRSCKCLAYTTVPFSVRNSLASACRTERGRFSVPHVSASGSRTTEGPFSVPDGESPRGYRVLRLRRSNLNTNMPLESNFRARL